jgi:tetratricopeptide (TPR) repeat protein
MWQMVTGPTPAHGAEFTGKAAIACDLARRLVTRDLPFLSSTDSLDTGPLWSASPLLFDKERGSLPRVLDGPSFGLAMCLAHASRLLALPVPSNVVACAEVLADGSVEPVGGLDQKVRMVARNALGVTRLLVERGQAGEAETLVASTGRQSLRVVGVRRVSDALQEVFPSSDLQAAMCERWANPAHARASADVFYRLALESAPLLLSWKVVENSARLLEQRLAGDETPEGELARKRAGLAWRIAGRHEGVAHSIRWPADEDLALMPRTIRFGVIAHVLQSAADLDDRIAEESIARVRPLVGPMDERCSGQARLIGALGRALAACGQYEEARHWLEEAIATWIALFEEDQMSYPLSEWLRVTGVVGNAAAIPRAKQDWMARMDRDARTSDISRAFVRLSLGRAFAQTGQPALALEALEGPSESFWQLTFDHVQDARGRWLARTLRAMGRHEEEAQVMTRMRESDQKWLAQMDLALHLERDPSRLLEALEKDEPGEVGRLRRRAETTDAIQVARFVGEHYRY